MNEIRYRARRWLFRQPGWFTTRPERWVIDAVVALSEGCPTVSRTLPSGRVVGQVEMPDGLADEIAFRRYARRSGEIVR